MINAFDSIATEDTSHKGSLTPLQQKAYNIEAAGYALIPLGSNGNPRPYGADQNYPASLVSCDADRFGVRLDNLVLLDYDGNKELGVPTLEDMASFLGMTLDALMKKAIQWREVEGGIDGSLHWLFRLPDGFDRSTLKCSNDGAFTGVDVKSGNQLVYIKSDKTLPGNTIPRPSDLLPAPEALLKLLEKPLHDPRTMAPVVVSVETSKYGGKALSSACDAISKATPGHRNQTLNSLSLGIYQLVAGGEISNADADSALNAAGLASGLKQREVQATLNCVKRKGISEPRKAPDLKRDEQREAGQKGVSSAPNNVVQLVAPTVQPGARSFLSASTGTKLPKFSEWDGVIGDCRDADRKEISAALKIDLRNIPPVVILRSDKDGNVSGFKAANHRDNLHWVAYRLGVVVARNQMTWAIESLNAETMEPLDSGDEVTVSNLVGAASQYGLPDSLVKSHFYALADGCKYHPIEVLLAGREWDGVPRVQDVFDCVPVKDQDKAMRDHLLTADVVGSIAAIDDGHVSMKIVPTLFSAANDYCKTAFLRRLGDIMPGAFIEGADIKPESKDSVRAFVCCWRAEIGEADKLTNREAGALFKSFMPLNKDTWRQEYSATFTTKPRQMTACATVNIEDFIKDPTSSSRLPVINLTAPIDIDRVNEILGWELVKGHPKLVDREKLIQFWLEVRYYRDVQGKTHQLDLEVLAEMKARNTAHIASDPHYESAKSHVLGNAVGPYGQNICASGEWFTPTDICLALKLQPTLATRYGRALKALEKEGLVESKKTNRGILYRRIK